MQDFSGRFEQRTSNNEVVPNVHKILANTSSQTESEN
jgi:hypothetical protein